MIITRDAGTGNDTIALMLSGVTLLSSVMTPTTSELNVTLVGKPHRGFHLRRADRRRARSPRRPHSRRDFESPTYEVTSNTRDQQNRLVRAIIGAHESVYEYDGVSKRWRITEKESGPQTKQETFIWCGSRICQKRTGSTVVRSYFTEGFEESGTTDYFYTRDRLGSVREVMASDGTTVASRVGYDPWGKITETGSGAATDFAFTGHLIDRPTGLGLTWFRAYDPTVGRWLSKDPVGLRGGTNLYGYVDGDPVNHTDPLGLWKICFPVGLFFEVCISGPDKPPPSCKPNPKPEPGPPPNPQESCPLVGVSPGAPPTCHYRCNSDGHTFDRDGELHGEKLCADSAER